MAASTEAWEILGLKEFRRELRAIDRVNGERVWSRELGRTHRELAQLVAGKAATRARAEGGQVAHFADTLRGRGTGTAARITWAARANTGFMGAKKRTGWFGRARYRDVATRQHPEWVGNSWTAGGPGGPRAVNPTIRDNLPRIVNTYNQMLGRITRRAFPS